MRAWSHSVPLAGRAGRAAPSRQLAAGKTIAAFRGSIGMRLPLIHNVFRGISMAPEGPHKEGDQAGASSGSLPKDRVPIGMFRPKMGILPPSQRTLWPALAPLAGMGFVLYGGTAIALRLGHRASVDFDFFTERPFQHGELLAGLPFAKDAVILQQDANTLTLSVTVPGDPEHPVKVSFFGGLTMGRVRPPERTEDGVVLAASMLDLLANKLKVIHERAEKKDYLDIHGILGAGHDLAEGLACGRSLFGNAFQPTVALQAMTYFRDGNLEEIPAAIQQALIRAAASVDELPSSPPVSKVLGVAG